MENIKLLIIIWTLFKIEFLLVLPIIHIKRKRKKYNYLVDYTDNEFKKCGGITGFVGPIGSYKSSLMNAKKSADTRNNIRELQKRLDGYVVKYPYLNFFEINNKLEVLFETNRSYQDCYNELFKGYNGYSYDYINLSSFKVHIEPVKDNSKLSSVISFATHRLCHLYHSSMSFGKLLYLIPIKS